MASINRRRFLLGSAVLGSGIAAGLSLARPMFAARPAVAATTQAISLFGCCQLPDGLHALSAIHRGQETFCLPLPGRGHDVVARPDAHQLVVLARRPGSWMQVVNVASGQHEQDITLSAGFTVNGHAAFSADGRYLFTTETATASGQGYVSIYDAADRYRFVNRFASGGIDPHELLLMPDGKTLVIANGGTIEAGDNPVPVNVDSMQSSLAYADIASGKLLAQFFPDKREMSLRHLAVSAAGEIFVGVQYHGNPEDDIPLLLSHKGDNTLQPFTVAKSGWRGLDQYVASVACTASGKRVAVTSPRGGLVMLFDGQSRELLSVTRSRDVAGAFWSDAQASFVFSNSVGQLMALHAANEQQLDFSLPYLPDRHWDNHMLEGMDNKEA